MLRRFISNKNTRQKASGSNNSYTIKRDMETIIMTLYVGIDVAKNKHDLAILGERGEIIT